MTNEEKLTTLKALLGVNDEDTLLQTYLTVAENEIIGWLYVNYADIPEGATMPTKYDMTQINACVAGYGIRGAENQTGHNENGINRSFKYSDMLEYIQNNVVPYARVV